MFFFCLYIVIILSYLLGCHGLILKVVICRKNLSLYCNLRFGPSAGSAVNCVLKKAADLAAFRIQCQLLRRFLISNSQLIQTLIKLMDSIYCVQLSEILPLRCWVCRNRYHCSISSFYPPVSFLLYYSKSPGICQIFLFRENAVFVLKPDVFSGLYRPVLADSRISFYLVNDRHKVSVKADVYHFIQSGVPDAGILL